MTYQYRNDSVPGFIYLLESEGFHGWIPGCVLRRVKIGLSRDVDRRVDTLHSNQPCCDYKIIRVIYVENMELVEKSIHNAFKHCNVKLKKSREYFDVLPHQYARIHWLMTKYETKVWSFADIPKRAIIGGVLALVSIGLLLGHGVKDVESKVHSQPKLHEMK